MFEYGNVIPLQMEVVCLNWRQIPMAEDSLPKHLPQSATIYAFQGCHDSGSNFGVLYVGQAKVLEDRVPQSLCERLFWKEKAQVGMYSDVWHLALFIAELEQKLLDRVEAVLIASHAPPFNIVGVRGASSVMADTERPLMLNGGRKGALLPVVCGAFYLDELWP